MTRRKIAILGGGLGAMSAAYALTAIPGWRERFEIDVYQTGWRLGGKGASGRNANEGQRIEEHGLHVWLGFYQNAFAMIQHCYEELTRVDEREGGGAPSRWTDAFTRHSEIAVMDHVASGYRKVRIRFPESSSEPGGTHPSLFPSLSHYVGVGASLLRSSVSAARAGELPRWRDVRTVIEAEVATKWARWFGKARSERPSAVSDAAASDSTRAMFQVVDLFATLGLGLLVDVGLRRKRLDDLDDEEFLEWLARWGADPLTLESSLLRGIYDMGFAFDEGDPKRPNFAAGAFIRAMLRILFTYEGAIFWKMEGGMGDVVFAPLYRVLRARGVRFHFFHRVERIEPSDDGRSVATIVMTEQAKTRSGEYSPLRSVNGELCWPHEPDFSQLLDADELERRVRWFEDPREAPPATKQESRVLVCGRDFDDVVLGIPHAALRSIATSLARVSPRFGRMLLHVQTVQTQAAQLWLKPSLTELGHDDPPPVLAGYVEPLNTWADMTHLVAREGWEAGRVGSLAYYCGPREGPEESPLESPAAEVASVEAAVRDVLSAKTQSLWPRAAAPDGGFDRTLLASEYYRVNSAPSERYVLTAAGTTRFRLAPDDSGFSNLYLCGDWTRNDFNTGCVEATVMSGLKAARAVARYPFRIVGEQRGRLSSRTSLWAAGART